MNLEILHMLFLLILICLSISQQITITLWRLALKSKGKEPVSEFCRWNNYAEAAGIESKLLKKSKYQPTVSQPLVYHLHGDIDVPQSMVLTENDYIDFIVTLSRGDDNSLCTSYYTANFCRYDLIIHRL